MSYRVFARKYRPQTFEEVVGQDHITRTLRNAIERDRLAQAYLFVGPRGIGKTSTARILAKALNCVNGPTAKPCGVCDACREIAEGNSLDVLEIDGASNNSVDHIRELRENAAFAPARGPYKIYLVDEVHMLSTAAFNALLKTLEEPPAHVKFIFATTESQKVPATITSRCQRFDLRRIPADLIAAHLLAIAENEKVELDDAAAAAVARGADGGLRDAESMLDQLVAFCGDRITADDVLSVFGFTSRETVVELTDRIFDQDAAGSLAVIREQSDAGKDLSRLLTDVIAHLRDVLIREFAGSGDGATGIPRDKLLILLEHFADTESRMRWAPDKRLVMDVAVVKAVTLIGEASLDDVIGVLAELGGDSPEPAQPTRPAVGKLTPEKERPPRETTTRRPPTRAVPLPEASLRSALEAEDQTVSNNTGATEPANAPTNERPATEPAGSAAAADSPAPDDPSAVWRSVVEQFASDSVIRFAWLTGGEFISIEEGVIRVRFPESMEENTLGLLWTGDRKKIEARMSERLGSKISLECEFSPEMREAQPHYAGPEPEAVEGADGESASPQPEATGTGSSETGTDPNEEFRNDPLIQKALEIFKARIQKTTS